MTSKKPFIPNYISEIPFEQRQNESTRMREKYPDRIPVIVERNNSCKLPVIDKKKYLVPSDLTIGHFTHIVRKRIKLEQTTALFLFINDTIPSTSALMTTIYEHHKNDDGFLYIIYTGENAFGE